ncbi:MAG TPA: condensation domain-containing protein [Pseudonocardiaceae bacterium]
MSDPNSVPATGFEENGARENGAQDNEPELPLTLLDEALLHLQNARSQWNVQFELGTGHHVDEEAFRKAVMSTCQRHPLTRARIAPWKKTDNSYQWNVVDDLDIDPVWVADCPDNAALAHLRTELYTLPIDLEVAPGLRIALARRPHGDLVLLSASHIIADGVGVVRLMQSIARAYRGEPDPPDPLPLAEARDLGFFLAPKTRNEKWARNWEALRRLREAFDSPSRIAVVGGTDSEDFGFVFRTLDIGDTTTPGLLNRKSGTTINDVLLAALHLTVQTWNTRYDMSTHRVGVMMPVNVRPADRFWEVVSNITSMVTVSTSADDRADLETATAAVAGQTTQVRREDRAYGLYDLLDATKMAPLPIKRVAPKLLPHTGDRFVDTAMLSNLGRLPETPSMDPPDSGERSPELWFSPPCDPTCSVAIGIITSGRRLSLVTRYRNDQFDTEAAAEFTDLLISQFTGQNGSAQP